MLTPDEAFKIGFLMACADRGMTGGEAAETAASLADAVVKRASLLDNTAGQLLMGVPIALGAGAGMLAHQTSRTDIDEEDVRQREMIEELKHWARRAREAQRLRAYRAGEP